MNSTADKFVKGIYSEYVGKRSQVLAEIEVYLNSPVGVGEHSKISVKSWYKTLYVYSTLNITTCGPVHLPLAEGLLADIGELSPVLLHDLTDHPPHPTVLGEDGIVVLGEGNGPLARIIAVAVF